MRLKLIIPAILILAGCPGQKPGPQPGPTPGPTPGPGPWVDPHYFDCAQYDHEHCDQAKPQQNRICKFDPSTGACAEIARADCSDYFYAECESAKPASGRRCEVEPITNSCRDGRDTCKDYGITNYCTYARPQNGLNCQQGWFVKDQCEEVAKTKCDDFTAAQCALASLADGAVCEVFANGICTKSLRRCQDYDAANCNQAQPTTGRKCLLQANGTCAEIANSYSPRYFRTTDGRRLQRQVPFTMPNVLPIQDQRIVHCLGATSQYFRNDDEVVQTIIDLTVPLQQDLWTYRYERRTFGAARINQFPPFFPIPPVNSNERAGFSAPFPPRSAQGSGATANGLGLYVALDITSSMSYGYQTIVNYGQAEVFALETLVPAGSYYYAAGNNVNLSGGGNDTAQNLIAKLGLTQANVENCGAGVIIQSTNSNTWLILKDPSLYESVEFTGTHIPQATLRAAICGAIALPGLPEWNQVGTYLLNRVNLFLAPAMTCP